jgi:Domain of unknown function (DUF4412)
MKNTRLTLGSIALSLAVALPCSAGLHYKASTRVHDATGKISETQVEGWVSGDKAKVEFVDASGPANPFAQKGTYILTSNGGKDLYLVNPEEKSYAKWSLDGMMKLIGGMMNGLGPLLKIELGDPKVEKLLDEDGGEVAGASTRHLQYRTRYSMKVRVLGISSNSEVDSVEDLWLASKWTDAGLGVWLRADPPRTGNAGFDKLIDASRERGAGFPLKSTIVSTTTQSKGKRQTVTRTTTEVTELKSASVPDSTFALPAGYSEVAPPAAPGEEGGEAGGLGALFQKRPDGGK